jgi:hypothetical protein
MYTTEYHSSTNYGTKELDINKANWIPNYTKIDSVVLVSTSNSSESYLINGIKIVKSYGVDLKEGRSYDECGITHIFTHDGTANAEALEYKSTLAVIQKLQMDRGLLIESKMDSAQFKNAPEYFRIIWNNIHLTPDLNKYTNEPNKNFHAAITLNKHAYDSVFECYSIHPDPNYIGPEGFYYSKKEGFLGFYITNHLQEWMRK